MHKSVVFLAALAQLAVGTDLVDRQVTENGFIMWDGRFLDHNTTAKIAEWSFDNRDGYSYQYYKHGIGAVDEYLAFDPTFKNPADEQSKVGVKMTVTDTSYWVTPAKIVETVRRTNLIPETTAAINEATVVGNGLVYYHFSIMRSDVNPLDNQKKHKFAFFEPLKDLASPLPYMTEITFGEAVGDNLNWNVANETQWSAKWETGVWHNFVYAIDFTPGDGHITLWHSTGGDDLVAVTEAVKTNTEATGSDWCLGLLVEPNGEWAKKEDIYFSGVYIEAGELTPKIAGRGDFK